MLTGENLVTLSGGVVADPERPTDNIIKFRLGVDRSGRDSVEPDKDSGYFDITYFLNGGDERNSNFVKTQVENGNLSKGSSISVVGRLIQERWEQDGNKRQKVVIIAESISYVSRGKREDSPATATAGATATASVADRPEVVVPTDF